MTNNKILPRSWVQKIAPEQLIQLIKSAVHFGHSVNCWNPKIPAMILLDLLLLGKLL